MSTDTPRADIKGSSMTKVVVSSMIGTSLEWYDFILYGSMAALVFNVLYFPNFDPFVSSLLSLSTFAIGFVSRPLGGIIFGPLGDKIGRRNVLVLTLILMGVTTTLIGLLPTYATIGVAAPLLLILLRFVQGMALGGEWSGSILMPVEYAGARRRGIAASLPQSGATLGLLMATGAIALVNAVFSEEQFMSWGWRLPFIFSAVLVGVGLWIRLTITETPVFRATKAKEGVAKNPIRRVVKDHWPSLLRALGARIGVDILYWTMALFVITYVTTWLGLPNTVGLLAVTIAAAVNAIVIPIFGALSDRVGRRPVMIVGALVAAAYGFAFFPLLDTKDTVIIVLATVGGMIAHGVLYGVQAAYISELFPAPIRYTGTSLGYQVAGIFGGALAPIISLLLLNAWGTPVAISVYLAAGLLLVAVTLFLSRETAFDSFAVTDLPEEEPVEVPKH